LSKPNGSDWEFVGPDYTEVKYFGEGAGIAIRKKDTDLAAQFNKAIRAIRANGVYKKSMTSIFPSIFLAAECVITGCGRS